jgi:hypothetical protein
MTEFLNRIMQHIHRVKTTPARCPTYAERFPAASNDLAAARGSPGYESYIHELSNFHCSVMLMIAMVVVVVGVLLVVIVVVVATMIVTVVMLVIVLVIQIGKLMGF